MLTSGNVWLLGGVIACSAFNTYLYFSWYPTYLIRGRDLDPVMAGWLASMVLGSGAIGGTLGGFLSDGLIRHTGKRRACRCGVGSAALAISAVFLLTGLHTDSPSLAAMWMALAVWATNMTLANWWGAVADISGRHLGALFGLMNSMGGVGAIASQLFLGRFVDWMGRQGFEGRAQWDPAFYLYASILALGSFGWLWIDTTRPVEPVPAPTPLPALPEATPAAVTTGIVDREVVHGVRAGLPAEEATPIDLQVAPKK
jgi:MFS family permease